MGVFKSRFQKKKKSEKGVSKIIGWLREQQRELLQNPEHKAFIWVDFDTLLKILKSKALTEKKKLDSGKQLEVGFKNTNQSDVYLYSENTKKNHKTPLKKRYGLLVSKTIELPTKIKGITEKEVELAETKSEIKVKPPKKRFFGRRFFEKPVIGPPEQISELTKRLTIFDHLDRIILGDEEEEEEREE